MYYHKEKHHQVNNSIICINAKNTLSGDLKEIENCKSKNNTACTFY